MTDILAALGLVLEGALYALFPEFMKRMAVKRTYATPHCCKREHHKQLKEIA